MAASGISNSQPLSSGVFSRPSQKPGDKAHNAVKAAPKHSADRQDAANSLAASSSLAGSMRASEYWRVTTAPRTADTERKEPKHPNSAGPYRRLRIGENKKESA